jgi:hypothetical protein
MNAPDKIIGVLLPESIKAYNENRRIACGFRFFQHIKKRSLSAAVID